MRAFVYYNSFASWGWLDTLDDTLLKQVEVVAGDVRDPHGVNRGSQRRRRRVSPCRPDRHPFLIHSPDSYVDTNVKGTLNVLQAARDLDLARVVITSTSEVYGTARYIPIDESHPRQGQSPYSASKIGADAMAESFARSFDLPVTTVRPFNTYGPRQSARAVIPTIIIQLLSGAHGLSLGTVTTTRDLTYVTDTCGGFIALATCDAAVGRDVNLGTGEETSIADLAKLLMHVVGHSVPIAFDERRERPASSEVQRLVSDNRLVRDLTGWHPTVSLSDGLTRTVDWFREAAGLPSYRPGFAT